MTQLHRPHAEPIELDELAGQDPIQALDLLLPPDAVTELKRNLSADTLLAIGDALVTLGTALSRVEPPSLRLDFESSRETVRGRIFVQGKETQTFVGAGFDLIGVVAMTVRGVAEQQSNMVAGESSRIAALCNWSRSITQTAQGLDATVKATLAAIEMRNDRANRKGKTESGEPPEAEVDADSADSANPDG